MGAAAGWFSVEQQKRIWDGWRDGESLGVIAGAVGTDHPRIGRFLRASGASGRIRGGRAPHHVSGRAAALMWATPTTSG